jgi:hypothetical protein
MCFITSTVAQLVGCLSVVLVTHVQVSPIFSFLFSTVSVMALEAVMFIFFFVWYRVCNGFGGCDVYFLFCLHFYFLFQSFHIQEQEEHGWFLNIKG